MVWILLPYAIARHGLVKNSAINICFKFALEILGGVDSVHADSMSCIQSELVLRKLMTVCQTNTLFWHYIQDGRRLLKWTISSSVLPLNSLKVLFNDHLACCTQLPDGYLEFIQTHDAEILRNRI